MNDELVYEYKGYEYRPWDDVDPNREDPTKTFHEVVPPEGDYFSLDFSPYRFLDKKHFKMLVDLDFPTRKDVDSIGPLRNEDIERLHEAL